MKVLGTIKTYVLRVWHSVIFKYAVVSIVGVLLVGFLDDNSMWSHIKNLQRIDELTAEKERYNAEFRRDQAQIKELDRNPKAIEKIARERYFMKADNEDIFILSDDDRVMRQLNKVQTIIYLLGAVCMTIGAGTSLLAWVGAPYVYCVGALGFASMQMLQRYEGDNFTIRRLRRMMLLSDVLFLVAGVLMFANGGNFLGLNHLIYIEYVYNKWVIVLLVAAILQLYSMHRISHELEKEAKKL